jgi:murein L,D-transpeptidase YcbB/YkuD
MSGEKITRSICFKSGARLLLMAGCVFLTNRNSLFSETSLKFSPVKSPTAVGEVIRNRISQFAEQTGLLVREEPVWSFVLVSQFYSARDYEPAWIQNSQILPSAKNLLNAVKQSDREGLNPWRYHTALLDQILEESTNKNSSPYTLADVDMLLTDAFLTLGSHLLSGCINPYSVDNEWFADRRTGNLPSVLEEAVASDDVRETLRSLYPKHPFYNRMREALARYRTFEKNGGWPEIPEGESIHKGDKDSRVPLLRERLYIEGDLNQKPHKKDVFDASLERALIRFQRRHGQDADGVLGKETVKVLNIPVEFKVRQIRVNMERCRWLPADLGPTHIFVNVPDFHLDVIENGKTILDMKVVVGRKLRRTPVFSSVMNQIVLNPSWSVPKTIATKDILDHIREEPDYLEKNGFQVFSGYETNAPLVDSKTVDWSLYNEKNLPFHFYQKPGPTNALGKIKFLFPNRFDVYLHDTSSRELFQKRVRDFSSGCIRIEKPIDLALFLLGDKWSKNDLTNALKKGTEQYISIDKKMPVHLLYWTAWVDDQDNVQFRDDIYSRDKPLDEAIHEGPIKL